ncbi:MAG: hypothetical protein Q4C61_17945, partial [Lachnospiraceae bacterium]|nr:hypothetical protein [Lachnospiraceae bacterium]
RNASANRNMSADKNEVADEKCTLQRKDYRVYSRNNIWFLQIKNQEKYTIYSFLRKGASTRCM